jgi:hypothetical protein
MRWYDPIKCRQYAQKTPGINDVTCEGCLWLIFSNITLHEPGFEAEAVNAFSILMQERVKVEFLEDISIVDRIGKFQGRRFRLDLILSIINVHLKRKVWTLPLQKSPWEIQPGEDRIVEGH